MRNAISWYIYNVSSVGNPFHGSIGWFNIGFVSHVFNNQGSCEMWWYMNVYVQMKQIEKVVGGVGGWLVGEGVLWVLCIVLNVEELHYLECY